MIPEEKKKAVITKADLLIFIDMERVEGCKLEPSHLGSLQPFHATYWPSLYILEHCGYEVNPWECLDRFLAPTSPKFKNACCQHLSQCTLELNLCSWAMLTRMWLQDKPALLTLR